MALAPVPVHLKAEGITALATVHRSWALAHPTNKRAQIKIENFVIVEFRRPALTTLLATNREGDGRTVEGLEDNR